MADNLHAFTVYGWTCCIWVLVVSFQVREPALNYRAHADVLE
jgi:hypothetical protein